MRLIAICFISALLFIGCSQKSEEELWQDAVQLQKQEDSDGALAAYQFLLEKYPGGTRAPEALYAMGSLVQNAKRDYPRAIGYYRKLVADYPTHPTSSNAAFMVGFIYNNELKKVDSAKIAYESFLQKYPQSPMVSSAQFELETLGKTPEQILADKAVPIKKPAKNKKR
jgi:TolA-binding protein